MAHPSRPSIKAAAPVLVAPPSSRLDEARRDDRSQITLRVDYKRMNTFFADYTNNISKGGTFIRTTKPLPIGTEFVFVLTVPATETQLRLMGEVKWIVHEPEATEGQPAGMGIRFKFVDDADRKRVEDFVEQLMRDALGSHLSDKLLKK